MEVITFLKLSTGDKSSVKSFFGNNFILWKITFYILFNFDLLCNPRVGMINVCSENDLYHHPHDVIITSQMPVSNVDVNANDN